MDVRGRAIALYGRFSPGARDRLEREIAERGGEVSRDLTRRSDALVVGALASALVDSGALTARLQAATARGLPVLGERTFLVDGAADRPATVPLATALGDTCLAPQDAAVLAVFDLIGLSGDHVRFEDASVLRTAGDLLRQGGTLGQAVRILAQAREMAPRGRHRIVLTPQGEAALQWQDGLTTLAGQGVLAFDADHASLEDLFEAAAIAEAEGDLDEAARLYDLCTRADRKDAIAPYNQANIRLAQGAHEQAALGYQQALARDGRFTEARYNLAQALEAGGREDQAAVELGRVLEAEPAHADAVFNLAQLTMKRGEMGAAQALWERYLALDPPDGSAQTARRAILYCAANRVG